MEVNLELYRIFFVVAKHLNITKAAKELHISQPAVSKQIKSLEEQLATTLFIRTKRGLILTETGNSILKNVKSAFELLGNVENELDSYKELKKGTISIGIGTTLTKIFLLKYLSKFHKLYPDVVINIYTDDGNTLKEMLNLGKLDILFGKTTERDKEKFLVKTLGSLNYIFACDFNLYKKLNGKVTKEILENYSMVLQSRRSNIRRVFDDFCDDNEIVIKEPMEINSSNLLISFVKAGFGLSFVTKEYAKEELANEELYELKCDYKLPSQNYGYLLPQDNTSNLALKKLLEMIEVE